MIANPDMLNEVITINSIDCQMMVQIILLLDIDRASIVFVDQGGSFFSLSCSTINIDGMLSVALDNAIDADMLPAYTRNFRSRYVSIFDQLLCQAREIKSKKRRDESIAKIKADAWLLFELAMVGSAAAVIAKGLWF